MTETATPVARREDTVETLHGVPVSDPYRWLEDGEGAETRAWTAAQNARTEEVLRAVPGRAALEARLGDLFRVGTVGSPAVRRGRFFYLRREGDQPQPRLCARDGDGPERTVVDPTALAPDGLTALDWWYPSPDGRLVAYGTSRGGDEWSTLRVVEVETGRVRPDEIGRTRYSSVAWLPDGGGFFYTRYPALGAVPPGEEEYNSHVFRHRLGEDPAADPKIFGEGRSPQDMIGVEVSPDGRWLVATALQGWARSEVYLRDLAAPDAPFVPVATGVDALFAHPVFAAGRLYLTTNWAAPNYRVVAVDPARPDPAGWVTVLPERPERVIQGVAAAGGELVALELEGASSRLRRYGLDGAPAGELPLPGLGTVSGVDGEPDRAEVVADFRSFVAPSTAFVFDLKSGARRPLVPGAADGGDALDAATVETEQVWYASKDGTRVSMFLVRRRGLARDGDNPTVLTGYGGFNIPVTPGYDPALPAWLERGGVYAVANLRGGGEYGEDWHRAGMLGNKQNVFDDVLAAAEWLCAAGWTRPERLAIEGGSNGGLLVGAAITQRPDLFRAAVCAVPLLDMVRYHRFRIARLWVPEYGTSEDPEAFRWLLAYSPYHRIQEGMCYPATLVTTGEQDSRVDPLHARKGAAALAHATACAAERPILLRAEDQAGHGQGKPLAKRVAEAADEWGFLGWQLGVDWAEGG